MYPQFGLARRPSLSVPPSRVYRYFDKEEFADGLCEGRLRLSTLARCRTIEDKERNDAAEATHRYYVEHMVGGTEQADNLRDRFGLDLHPTSVVGYTIFERKMHDAILFCTSLRFDQQTLARFGAYCVEIRELAEVQRALTQEIKKVCPTHASIYGPVRYGARDVDGIPALGKQAPMGMLKDQRFSRDEEFRFLWKVPPSGLEVPVIDIESQVLGGFCKRVA